MNTELKQLWDAFIVTLKSGAQAEAVAQIQLVLSGLTAENRKAMIDRMTKSELLKFAEALPLAWKQANELSAAECQNLLDAFSMIVVKSLAIALAAN